MKHLINTITAMLLMGCGKSQKLSSPAETKPVEPVGEASQPEPPTAKAPDISIHDAAKIGNIEAIKQHIGAGTEVNAKNKGGRTPLHWANNKEIAELLIDAGADVNAEDGDGDTSLDWAIMRNHTEIADLLHKHGGKTGEELKAEGK